MRTEKNKNKTTESGRRICAGPARAARWSEETRKLSLGRAASRTRKLEFPCSPKDSLGMVAALRARVLVTGHCRHRVRVSVPLSR
jgi:hypothetical protein